MNKCVTNLGLRPSWISRHVPEIGPFGPNSRTCTRVPGLSGPFTSIIKIWVFKRIYFFASSIIRRTPAAPTRKTTHYEFCVRPFSYVSIRTRPLPLTRNNGPVVCVRVCIGSVAWKTLNYNGKTKTNSISYGKDFRTLLANATDNSATTIVRHAINCTVRDRGKRPFSVSLGFADDFG